MFLRRALCKWACMGMITICVALLMVVSVSAQTYGVVTANKVNVRNAGSLTNSDVLYMVNTGQTLEIHALEGDFYRVSLNNDIDVYIAAQYVKVSQTTGVVLDGVNAWLFSAPSDDPANMPLGLMALNDPVTVTAVCGDWYYVCYNNTNGYVKRQYISIPAFVSLPSVPQPGTPAVETAVSSSNATNNGSVDDIIAYAKQFLGSKYRYGSMSPQKGFDCSGFVNYVMNHFGISLNRSSSSMASDGIAVDRSELQKGDLIFFATSGGSRISHVGMYIGDGQFIHASTYGDGVVITNLSDKYYSSRYVKARRVL